MRSVRFGVRKKEARPLAQLRSPTSSVRPQSARGTYYDAVASLALQASLPCRRASPDYRKAILCFCRLPKACRRMTQDHRFRTAEGCDHGALARIHRDWPPGRRKTDLDTSLHKLRIQPGRLGRFSGGRRARHKSARTRSTVLRSEASQHMGRDRFRWRPTTDFPSGENAST